MSTTVRRPGFSPVSINRIATEIELLLAEETFATSNGKGNDRAVAHLEFFHATADFDYFAHRLVAEDVPVFHRWHIAVIKV